MNRRPFVFVCLQVIVVLIAGACDNGSDGRPTVEVLCDNGIDDDYDFAIDCDDPDCSNTPTCLQQCNLNGICDPTEDSDSCPQDCPCDFDFYCEPGNGETPESCPTDCQGCNMDGYCDASAGENVQTCPQDCASSCGNMLCEPALGETSVSCPQDCASPCGNMMCEPALGETSVSCPADCFCGNGSCESNEAPSTCPLDCPPVCGDGTCEGGETATSCPADCATCTTIQDLLQQTGCSAGDACSLVSNVIQCATPGSNNYYADCSNGQGCVAGSGCVQAGASAECMPFCESGVTTCPSNGWCFFRVSTNDGVVGACTQPDACDPLTATGCTATEGCYFFTTGGDRICLIAGTVPQGGSCTYLDDCAAGFQCMGNPGECQQMCDLTSPTCPVNTTCTDASLSYNNIGVCQ